LIIYSVTDESSGEKLDYQIFEPGYAGSKIEIRIPKSGNEQLGRFFDTVKFVQNDCTRDPKIVVVF
jgi:hypothetical protein